MKNLGGLGQAPSRLRDLIDRSVAEVRLGYGLGARAHIVVADLVKELMPAAVQEAENRGLRFSVQSGEAGVAVHADRQILAAVVVNLLQNAFKFTRPGTSVGLSVSASEDRVLIEVTDECGGLEEGAAPDLFRPFQQRNADRTGLGLGLAFCRRGVELHGGHLSARNAVPRGCVFTVDLPRAPTAGLAPARRDASASSNLRPSSDPSVAQHHAQ